MDAFSQTNSNRGALRRLWPLLALGVLCVVLALLSIGYFKSSYLRSHAESLLRDRLVTTLSARFHGSVTLDSLRIDTRDGGRVSGRGLRIFYPIGPASATGNTSRHPMIEAESFEFQTDFRDMFHPATRIVEVFVRGLQLDIPPRGLRRGGVIAEEKAQADPTTFSLLFDRIVCVDSRIVIETSRPGKLPLVFDVARVTMTDVGAKKPLVYDATLTNPKPVGEIHATGHFGPWQAKEPSDTLLDGDYTFVHADLGTLKGVTGILSSHGHFDGRLGKIAIEGTTDTPNFQLDSGDHPVPLHTTFVAEVDGLDGDTVLKQVDATLLHSILHFKGSVVRVGSSTTGVTGHDTELSVSMNRGRIEDLLTLFTKTDPAIVRGTMSLRQRFSLPPGSESVSKRMKLAGSFSVQGAAFGATNMQDKIDHLSMTAQGHPAAPYPIDGRPVKSEIAGEFTQADGTLNFSMLRYEIPGATLKMRGRYLLAGNSFDFTGLMRTDATASQMTTGWKSLLLKSLDPLLKSDGAGLEVPITFSGTSKAPKLTLDMDRIFK